MIFTVGSQGACGGKKVLRAYGTPQVFGVASVRPRKHLKRTL